jgi:hypothetical protein
VRGVLTGDKSISNDSCGVSTVSGILTGDDCGARFRRGFRRGFRLFLNNLKTKTKMQRTTPPPNRPPAVVAKIMKLSVFSLAELLSMVE